MPGIRMQCRKTVFFCCLILTAVCTAHAQAPQTIPHLVKNGARTQLFVDGKPFLVLGGELMNSSSASAANVRSAWPRLAALHLNTVLTPVSWELVEPEEGHFDFSVVDDLLKDASDNHLHLVLLWLASWKNGMSSYAPLWVKTNPNRFPRATDRNGNVLDVLSPIPDGETQQADARAFAALMRHLREVDGSKHVVLMMQVENEVGILGATRDFSSLANRAFAQQTPSALLNYLEQHKDTLSQPVRETWQSTGFRPSGTWPEVFGGGQYGDEIFMAWNYASFIEGVVNAGKKEYPIPMYVNGWQAPLEYASPGLYPSGGPLARVLDIWRAAGRAIDFYSPDDYSANFEGILKGYEIPDNPLFVPEAKPGDPSSYNVFLALGKGAFGFSPFGVDHWEEPNTQLSKAYELLGQIAPQLAEDHPGRLIEGFALSPDRPKVILQMGGLNLVVSLDDAYYSHAKAGGGIIVMDDQTHLWGIGRGFSVAFAPASGPGLIGIGAADKEACTNGTCVPILRMNGDETNQGRTWRFPDNEFSVERISLFHY